MDRFVGGILRNERLVREREIERGSWEREIEVEERGKRGHVEKWKEMKMRDGTLRTIKHVKLSEKNIHSHNTCQVGAWHNRNCKKIKTRLKLRTVPSVYKG